MSPLKYVFVGSEPENVRLLKGWKNTLPEVDHKWISDTFFRAGRRGPEFEFGRVTKLWYERPHPSLSQAFHHKLHNYFDHRLFLWMPRHLFHVDLHCPQSDCTGTLTNAGIHQKIRKVVDVDSMYNMAGEDLSCSKSSIEYL
jgi:hypothetical protein